MQNKMWASPASKIIGEILFEKGSTYYNLTMLVKKKPQRDIPGCPVIKTSPSNAGAMGLIPCHVRSHLSHGQNTKTLKIKTEAIL